MAKFTAHFDASGKPTSKGAMFVSGFVSTVEKWEKFTPLWLAHLDEYGLSNPFHMTEFVAARKEPYKSLVADAPRASAFLNGAWRIIKKHIHKDFSQGVMLSAFHQVKSEYVIDPKHEYAELLNAPLTYCGFGAYLLMHDWANRVKARKRDPIVFDGPIEVIFDRGDQDRGKMIKVLEGYFDADLLFRDKAKVVPLQAADMLAWEHQRALFDWGKPRRRTTRKQLWEILRHLPGARDSDSWKYGQLSGLREFCELSGFKKRV
jgi:hypothetical protein